jgi:hypothetical protein
MMPSDLFSPLADDTLSPYYFRHFQAASLMMPLLADYFRDTPPPLSPCRLFRHDAIDFARMP